MHAGVRKLRGCWIIRIPLRKSYFAKPYLRPWIEITFGSFPKNRVVTSTPSYSDTRQRFNNRSWRNVTYSVLKEAGDEAGNKLTKAKKDFHMINDAPPKFEMARTFYKNLYDMWLFVKANLDPNPVVIDSDDLLADPARILSKYCAAVGIPYSDSLLKWDPNPAATDEWKCAFMPPREFQYIATFCHNALHSSEFVSPVRSPKAEDLTSDINEMVEISMPYYEEMYKSRMI